MLIWWLRGLFAALAVSLAAHAQAPKELHYYELPPLMFSDAHGQPRGRLVELLRQAWLDGQELPPLRLVPLKRSLQEILQLAKPVCVLGVFKTPEREAAAWLSSPLSWESPSLFITTRTAAKRLRVHTNFRAVVTDRSLRVVVTDGASYGMELDHWILERGGAVVRVSAPPTRQIHMLVRGHVDFMLSDTTEAPLLMASLGAAGANLEAFALPGAPTPPSRHLMCSRSVSPEWRKEIDARLGALR